MRYYMTYLVKDFFFVFFGHSAPVLRATKMALGNLDIRKIACMLSQVSIEVKFTDK